MSHSQLLRVIGYIMEDMSGMPRDVDLLIGEDLSDVQDELETAHRHIEIARNYLDDAFAGTYVKRE